MSNPKYRNLSLPDEFVKEIEKFIDEHPELGFTSLSEFIKNAARAYLEFRQNLLSNLMKNEESS